MTASYDRLKSRLRSIQILDNPVDSTVARYLAWHPMGQNFLAQALLVSGTGILTFKIFAATSDAGAGATVVKAHADPTVADAAGDSVHLEVSAEEVRAALAGATHVAVQMDNDHADDINVVNYLLEGGGIGGRFAYAGLSADVIA